MNSPFYGEIGELNLINVLVDLLEAGSDTTANTLNWAMLFMIQNPGIQTKVRQELNENIGSKKFKMGEKNKIPYTEAVLYEVQRKGNIVPSLLYQTKENIEIGDFSVTPNTRIMAFIAEIMNDPEHFPEPSKFMPER